MPESNRRPLECHPSALPSELMPQKISLHYDSDESSSGESTKGISVSKDSLFGKTPS